MKQVTKLYVLPEFVGCSQDALQALTWANTEPRYKMISDHTTGIIFFGTPHRGSEKATYGKALANVATTVMRSAEKDDPCGVVTDHFIPRLCVK